MKWAVHDSYTSKYTVFSTPETDPYIVLLIAIEKGYFEPYGGKEDWDEEMEVLMDNYGLSESEAECELASVGFDLIGAYMVDMTVVDIKPVPPNIQEGVYDSPTLKPKAYKGLKR